MRLQQAQANSRNLRSLALPRKNSSIKASSVQLFHSASVIRVAFTRAQLANPLCGSLSRS
jgi:hypothetical protein